MGDLLGNGELGMTATLPQARIPLGYAVIAGQRTPVEIDIEWMRAFTDLVKSTSSDGGASLAELLPLFFSVPPSDPVSQEAIRAVDELRNELSSARSDTQALRAQIEDQASLIAEMRRDPDLRNRVEQIEGRLQ